MVLQRRPRCLVCHQYRGSRIFSQVGHFFGGQQGGSGHGNSAALHGAQKGNRVIQAVRQTDQHSVACCHATVTQQLGKLIGAASQFGKSYLRGAQRVVFHYHGHRLRDRRVQMLIGASRAYIKLLRHSPLPDWKFFKFLHGLSSIRFSVFCANSRIRLLRPPTIWRRMASFGVSLGPAIIPARVRQSFCLPG